LGGDYAAWADVSLALEDWDDSEGIVLPSGLTFCPEHAGAHRCSECGDVAEAPVQTADGPRCRDCLADYEAAVP
jgi:hypothetical protein